MVDRRPHFFLSTPSMVITLTTDSSYFFSQTIRGGGSKFLPCDDPICREDHFHELLICECVLFVRQRTFRETVHYTLGQQRCGVPCRQENDERGRGRRRLRAKNLERKRVRRACEQMEHHLYIPMKR